MYLNIPKLGMIFLLLSKNLLKRVLSKGKWKLICLHWYILTVVHNFVETPLVTLGVNGVWNSDNVNRKKIKLEKISPQLDTLANTPYPIQISEYPDIRYHLLTIYWAVTDRADDVDDVFSPSNDLLRISVHRDVLQIMKSVQYNN